MAASQILSALALVACLLLMILLFAVNRRAVFGDPIVAIVAIIVVGQTVTSAVSVFGRRR